MFGLTTPWWLFALTVIPLIRWLHRWRAPLSRASVSALFLWTTVDAVSAGGLSQQIPDPAWRRRALIASLLILALAGPWLQRDELRITVWIDDTLSMATIEQDQSRLAEGLFTLVIRKYPDKSDGRYGTDDNNPVSGERYYRSEEKRGVSQLEDQERE